MLGLGRFYSGLGLDRFDCTRKQLIQDIHVHCNLFRSIMLINRNKLQHTL